jgi:hypothetical protein
MRQPNSVYRQRQKAKWAAQGLKRRWKNGSAPSRRLRSAPAEADCSGKDACSVETWRCAFATATTGAKDIIPRRGDTGLAARARAKKVDETTINGCRL